MAINVGSSRASPLFNCMAEIIRRLPGCLMLAGITVGLRSVITKHFASGIGITLCFRRNSIPSITSKSSMRTTTRSSSPVQSPILKETLLETPTIGKASELTAFIFPGSFPMVSPNLRAS
ncbi:uncharacterized protein LOC111433416 [Cucurbita moschata]|uniref:Uncharacterized protein LOC111433416 n=1 Tax=Cucurbita moschata TaxID=3662 RepID=A0A6J1EHG6_CUCMO|nr:uncharacterized protein LOC111433416 [Cucurbita moschata]